MKLLLEINLDNAAYQDDLMGELNSQFMSILNRIAIDDDTGYVFAFIGGSNTYTTGE